MKRKATYQVTFDLPEGATLADGKEYVLNAVGSYKGGLQTPTHENEGDPMFWLNRKTVRVTCTTRKVGKKK